MGQQRGVLGEPGPVHAVEDGVGQLADFGIVKVLAAHEHAAEQNRGVDRGDLGIPDALAGVDVGEVIEKSAMGR